MFPTSPRAQYWLVSGSGPSQLRATPAADERRPPRLARVLPYSPLPIERACVQNWCLRTDPSWRHSRSYAPSWFQEHVGRVRNGLV